MNVRTLLVLASLLASTVWAEEPAVRASTPSAFDLRSDAIRKIVHDTASSQSRAIQISEEKPVGRAAGQLNEFVPAEAPPAVKVVTPRPVAAPESDGILSTVIDTFVDTLLDGDDSAEQLRENYEVWKACHAQDKDCRLPPPPANY